MKKIAGKRSRTVGAHERGTKMLEGGRLIIEPYPAKSRFSEEDNRTDCTSIPVLHVEICHDFMSTVDLYDLLSHNFPPLNIPKGMMMTYCTRRYLEKKTPSFTSVLMVNNITLHESTQKDWATDPASWINWTYPQMLIWYDDASREAYRLWIAWCRRMLTRVERWGTGTMGKIYNPYEKLRFRVRIEFHD